MVRLPSRPGIRHLVLSVLLLAAISAGGPVLSSPGSPGRARPGARRPAAPPGQEDAPIPDGRPIRTFDPPSSAAGTAAENGGTNVRANRDSSGRDQTETTIAINPLDGDNLVGGANDARLGHWAAGYYVTHDGGLTWTDGTIPWAIHAKQGDPTVAFCGDGVAVFGYLDYEDAWQPHRLVVTRSTDGGDTWEEPGVVVESQGTPFADKPYIACARAPGAYQNRVYVSWTWFTSPFGGPIRVMTSDDHGRTWTNAHNISGTAGVQGSVPAPGRDGEVYVFWRGPGRIEFARSTNGGASWSSPATVSPITEIGDGPHYRRNSFPTAAVDISGGPYDGTVYVAWADGRNGDADILLSRSTDHGQTWSEPVRVNDDPPGNGRDQYFPWLAVDDEGLVHLSWIDHRERNNSWYHVYIATSRDGGVTFDRNLRVTDVPSDGSLTGFLGDYTGLAAGHGRIVPLWPDLRAGTGEEDVYIEVEPAFEYDIVSGVVFRDDKRTLDFTDQEPRLGEGIVYDVLLGNVADLAGGAPWEQASCLAEELDAPPADVPDEPAPGEALYVLVRAHGPRGRGSWGSGSGHPDPRDGFDDHSPCGD